MRRFVCLIALALLVGCDSGPPRIDGSSEAAFRESVQRVKASLSPEKLKEFEASVGAASAESMLADGLRPGASLEQGKQSLFKALDGKTADEVIAAGNAAKARHGIP